MMLEKIKIRLAALGILESKEDTAQDEILALMIADTVDAVLLYCHRTRLPDRLEYLVREIVVRVVRAETSGNVSAVKRGDTQINYNAAIGVDSFTEKDKAALNACRRMRIG